MRAQDAIGFGAFPVPASEPQRLWGRDLIELHDHFWRQAGVTVVRPGSSHESQAGRRRRRTRAYLLLGLDELAAFSPGTSLRRLIGSGKRSILIQLEDADTTAYSERIDADDRDALVAIRRDYVGRASSPAVLMTRDERLAGWWRRWVHPARHPRAASAVDRALARRRRPINGAALGVLEDATDTHGSRRWIESIMRLDASLAETVPGVRERELGVWVHESARIGPHVSLAGPLWIGEHVVLDGNTSLVGPHLMADDAAPTPRTGVTGAGPSRRAGRDEIPDWARQAQPMMAPAATPDTPAASTPAEVPAGVRTAQRILDRLRGRRRTAAATRNHRAPASDPLVPAVERIISERPTVRPEPWTVRAFNVAFSLSVLTAILPLFPLIMLVIYLEDGRPFFFGHTRQTRGGRNFTCWKFRTMCRDAERMKAQLAQANVCDGPQFHIVDDPRLLRIGRLLRRFHLDELPQLWNVLRGDMNLVGPRPSPDDENQYCPAWREARLSVKPGLTGLWQIRRTRAPMADFQEWIRWDLEYIARRSWRLDVWIIWRTAMDIVRRGGDEAAPVSEVEGDPLATMTGFHAPSVRRLPATAVAMVELKVGDGDVDAAQRPATGRPSDAELIRDAIDAVIDGGAATARRFEDLEPMVYDDADVDAGTADGATDRPASAADRLDAIGLDRREADADANAAAVRQAAARSRAEAMARTTLTDAADLRDGADIRTRIDAEIARGDGGGDRSEDRTTTGTTTGAGTEAAPISGGRDDSPPEGQPERQSASEAEAKPRQPEAAPGARGVVEAETKPAAAGEAIAGDGPDTARNAVTDETVAAEGEEPPGRRAA